MRMRSCHLNARAPSTSAGWMAVIVVFAAVMTPFIAMAEGWLVWWGSPEIGPDAEGWLTIGPTVVVGGLLILALSAHSAIPRIVRTALLVPLFHIGLMIALWAIWRTGDIPLIKEDLLRFLERHGVTNLIGGDALVVGAALSGGLLAMALVHQSFRERRNLPGWLRPAVTFCISYLFSLGLWLPVAAQVWGASLTSTFNFLAMTLAAPVAPALIVALLSRRRDGWSFHGCGALSIGLAVTLGLAVAVRTNAGPAAQALFANLIPVILCAALVTLGAVVALAICQWRELRYHRADGARTDAWVQRGVVEASAPRGTPVGIVTFSGWLGGFHTDLAPFAIRTDGGHLVQVPRGSQLSATPGPESATANAGDYVVALRVGDPVVATGYEEPVADGPFRSSSAPIPGDRGILVFGSSNPPPHVGLSLLLWRPAALYLLASMAAIIPALLGTE